MATLLVFICRFSTPLGRRSERLFIESVICIFVWPLDLIKDVHKVQILLHQRWAKRHKNQCFAAARLVKMTTMTYDGYDVFVIGKKRSFYANRPIVNLFNIMNLNHANIFQASLAGSTHGTVKNARPWHTDMLCKIDRACMYMDVIRTLNHSLILWFSVYLSALWIAIKCIRLYLLSKSRF